MTPLLKFLNSRENCSYMLSFVCLKVFGSTSAHNNFIKKLGQRDVVHCKLLASASFAKQRKALVNRHMN